VWQQHTRWGRVSSSVAWWQKHLTSFDALHAALHQSAADRGLHFHCGALTWQC
jgi:hypothetical protein